MNDKILSIAFMLTFIMIGINAFLYMGSTNLYDEEGNQLNIYYGLDTGGFGTQVQTKAEDIEIGTDLETSSTVPSQQQGIVIAKTNNEPTGLSYTNELAKLGIGVQLVMLKLSDLFPIMSPILNGIVIFAFAVQGLAIAYLTSILVRGILGRIT